MENLASPGRYHCISLQQNAHTSKSKAYPTIESKRASSQFTQHDFFGSQQKTISNQGESSCRHRDVKGILDERSHHRCIKRLPLTQHTEPDTVQLNMSFECHQPLRLSKENQYSTISNAVSSGLGNGVSSKAGPCPDGFEPLSQKTHLNRGRVGNSL